MRKSLLAIVVIIGIAIAVLTFTSNGSADPSISAPPTTVTSNGATLLVEPTVTVERTPGPLTCLDGTEHIAEVRQVQTWPDGSQPVVTTVLTAEDCRPWPTHCLNGNVFVPPNDQTAFKCLAWGRPLFEWYTKVIFGSNAARMSRDITRESGWNPRALGPRVCNHHRCANAIGLTQLLGWEGLARRMGQDIWSPWGNLIVAREVLRLQGWSAWSTDTGR